MKQRQIIFSGEMVRAILAGNKTQTRRVIKPQPANGCHYEMTGSRHGACHLHTESFNAKQFDRCYVPPRPNFASPILPCPYGKPGDFLWVREAWNFISDEIIVPAYRADSETQIDKWKSPIFMPREASRITLEITNVRVEQVAGISIDDCFAEGIQLNGRDTEEVRNLFRIGWNKLNSKRGFYWSEADIPNNMRSGSGITICINPWVWVIEFKKL